MKLHTKYQRPGPSSFRKEDFYLSIQVYVKQVTPGMGPFLTPGYSFNNLGRSPQDKATFQIPKAYLLVPDMKILKVLPIGDYVKNLTFP